MAGNDRRRLRGGFSTLLLTLLGCLHCSVPTPQLRAAPAALRNPEATPPPTAVAPASAAPPRADDNLATAAVHICSEEYRALFLRGRGPKPPLEPALLVGNPGAPPLDPFAAQTTLRAVWAFSEDLVVAVGDQGAIVHWDGKRWSPQRGGTVKNLHAVFGLSASQIWAVGDSGVIVFFDGKTWALQGSGTGEDLLGIHGADEGNLWIVGTSGTILRWTQAAWQVVGSPAIVDLFAVSAQADGAVRVGGQCRTRLTRRGDGWVTEEFTLTDSAWLAIRSDAQSILFAGSDNSLFDGRQYLSSCSEYVSNCEDYGEIWGSDPNHLWIIGGSGRLLFRDSSGRLAPAVPTAVQGIHGLSNGSIWVVGERAQIWKYSGNRWNQVDPARPRP